MQIKSKSDVQKLVNFMKESGNKLKFVNSEGEVVTYIWDGKVNYFRTTTDIDTMIIDGMGYETDIINSLYAERKYVNIVLYHWFID
jgi:hypothetical protein